MDWSDSNATWEMSKKLKLLTEKYSASRGQAAQAKYALDIMLASKMSDIRTKACKKHVGYESAIIVLLEIEEESHGYYQQLLRHEASYKSLERMIEAQNSQLMLAMSLAKNQSKQGG